MYQDDSSHDARWNGYIRRAIKGCPAIPEFPGGVKFQASHTHPSILSGRRLARRP
ncbi:MAG: hypothetical protein Q7S86_05530 [bacterium]|nr:hypothetical protein [bacterium]